MQEHCQSLFISIDMIMKRYGGRTLEGEFIWSSGANTLSPTVVFVYGKWESTDAMWVL